MHNLQTHERWCFLHAHRTAVAIHICRASERLTTQQLDLAREAIRELYATSFRQADAINTFSHKALAAIRLEQTTGSVLRNRCYRAHVEALAAQEEIA